MRALLRRGGVALGASAALFAVGVLAGLPVAWPFDAAITAWPVAVDPALLVATSAPHVVVLQHGLFRSEASMFRLARALAAHGFEPLNPGYASTRGALADHAAALAAAIAARRDAGPVGAWSFVGHSMGGLVVREYLRRADAVRPTAVVTLGTPHRGAVLADLRKRWFLFRWAMGDEAAFELSPGDAQHARPWPAECPVGAIAGQLDGDGNPAIPGPDDGTVAVGEALPAAAAARLVLPLGHTRLSFADASVTATLHFLARGSFPPVLPPR